MIQLSDYDYPILVNPFHFIGCFGTLSDEEYLETFKIHQFFVEIIKNGVLYEKGDNIAPLMKRYKYPFIKPLTCN